MSRIVCHNSFEKNWFCTNINNSACGHRMAHRKWKETKQQPSLLPDPAVPGCSLFSFHFLSAILCLQAVYYWLRINSLLWKFLKKIDSRLFGVGIDQALLGTSWHSATSLATHTAPLPPRFEIVEASVLMQRPSYPTETVLSNNTARNRIVLSFKDSSRKPLGRRPLENKFLLLELFLLPRLRKHFARSHTTFDICLRMLLLSILLFLLSFV